jgi:hypothetical protein
LLPFAQQGYAAAVTRREGHPGVMPTGRRFSRRPSDLLQVAAGLFD